MVCFLTGLPGFLGTRLLARLAAHHPAAAFRLLVQPKFEAAARAAVADLGLAARTTLHRGDITQPTLGLDAAAYDALAQEVTRAFHLAAVYDLAIARDVAWRVNVDGTRHVLDFLEACPRLEHAAYVSTAYVSGRRTGLVTEDELVHAAGFKNFYEETKYHAEVLVHDRFDHLPLTVFRPAIVVGDSQTGATAKFDGPYFILNALRQLPRYTLMARVGTGTRTVNLVPVDFVVPAMARLAQPAHAGTVFHLTDPQPATTQAIMARFAGLLGMRVAYVSVPTRVARRVVATDVGRTLGLAPELIDYFDHPVAYDSTRTQRALAGTGLTCPHVLDYAPQMVRFAEAHTDTRAAAMY